MSERDHLKCQRDAPPRFCQSWCVVLESCFWKESRSEAEDLWSRDASLPQLVFTWRGKSRFTPGKLSPPHPVNINNQQPPNHTKR